MLRDDSSGAGRRHSPRNVLGESLDACSIKPMTGFYRDGCCDTGSEDIGNHTVCVVVTCSVSRFFCIARQRSLNSIAGVRLPRA